MREIWKSVQTELDCWADQGRTARFWVRDDDASTVSGSLARLRVLALDQGITIGLAVIPGLVHFSLLEFLATARQEFFPMCHGWKHINHGTKERPCEFGDVRPLSDLRNDAQLAYTKFREFFGSSKAIFVPPWSCIAAALIDSLPGLGFAGVSFGPRLFEARLARLAEKIWIPGMKIPGRFGVARLSAQIDVIDWQRGTARDMESIAKSLIGHLRLRRRGFLEAERPIGVLTHHLAHDEQTWRLCGDLLDYLRRHKAVEFFDIAKEVASVENKPV